MIIYLVAIGTGMPRWVKDGFEEYSNRLKQEIQLKLIEVPALPRKKNSDLSKILKEESDKLLSAIPKNCKIVGLDVIGDAVTTLQLSKRMESWLFGGQDIALLIGGPEGFDDRIKSLFTESLSLSKLTLPHPLVRVIIAEQLFRGWSILHNHPYHRE